MDDIGLLKTIYTNIQDMRNKRLFLQRCRKSGVIPTGLSLHLNLAIGVNEPVLVNKIETILEQASSSVMNAIESFCEEEEEEYEVEYIAAKEVLNEDRAVTKMKREVNNKMKEKVKSMDDKLNNLKTKVVRPQQFVSSQGSRKIKAQCYRSACEKCGCVFRGKPAMRKHRQGRHGGQQEKRRRQKERRRRREVEERHEDLMVIEEERRMRSHQ